MFREIRLRGRALSEAEAREILARADWGVLSSLGEDGWPYGVPVHHVVLGDQIYIHCAQTGHKLENLSFEPKVSYCAVTRAEILPSELSTDFESAILFGRAEVVADEAERRLALEALLARFAPRHPEEGAESMRKHFARTTVLRITPERITGKARRRL